MDFTELCHVSAVLFDCNIVKLPIELLQNVAQVLRIMYFLFKSILLGKMIILCNNMYPLEHKLISNESILSLSMTIN